MSSPLDLVDLAKLIRDHYSVDMDTAVAEAVAIEAKYSNYNEFISLLHEVYPDIEHEDAQKEAWYYFMNQIERGVKEGNLDEMIQQHGESTVIQSLIPAGGTNLDVIEKEVWEELSEGYVPVPIDEKSVEPVDILSADDKPSKSNLALLESYLSADHDLALKFRGNYTNQWGWLMWLQDNLPYDTFCVYMNESQHGKRLLTMDVRKKKRHEQDSTYKQVWRKSKMLIDEGFFPAIKECRTNRPNARFVIGLLNLPGHANALIFDFDKKTITRFEPHGGDPKVPFRPKVIDYNIIMDLVKGNGTINFKRKMTKEEKEVFLGWRYISPVDYCPNLGPQALEGKLKKMKSKDEQGYCVPWSMIFMQYRVMNPDLSEEQVARHFEAEPQEMLNLIRGYASFMLKNMELPEEDPTHFKVGELVLVTFQGKKLGHGIILRQSGRKFIIQMDLSEMSSSTKVKDFAIHTARVEVLIKVDDEYLIDYHKKKITENDLQRGDYVYIYSNTGYHFDSGRVIKQTGFGWKVRINPKTIRLPKTGNNKIKLQKNAKGELNMIWVPFQRLKKVTDEWSIRRIKDHLSTGPQR